MWKHRDASSDADPTFAYDGDLPDTAFLPPNDGAVIGHAQGNQCSPPCDPSEWCYVVGGGPGGAPMLPDGSLPDAGAQDASVAKSPGCHALPAQCLPDGTCACIESVVQPFCLGPSVLFCNRMDAGYPRVACIFPGP